MAAASEAQLVATPRPNAGRIQGAAISRSVTVRIKTTVISASLSESETYVHWSLGWNYTGGAECAASDGRSQRAD